MFHTITTILGLAAAVLLTVHFATRWRKHASKRGNAPDDFFARVKPLIEDARFESKSAVGYPQLVGRYRDLPVRLHAVIDTLAIRKLPSLWLLATIPEPLPLKATFDLMMRPAGPTTFSNFDHLPVTLDALPDLPPYAVVRTDDAHHVLPYHVVAPHLDVLTDPRIKELLITPKGLRLVRQIAEADRARYGIFREAEFGAIELDPQLTCDLLDRLIALRKSILDWADPK